MPHLLALLFLLLTAPAAGQTTIRLAAWNIADLTHLENTPLRPGISPVRRAADFAALGRYAAALDADIVALQEIGTVAAAELLFPAPAFTVYPSARLAAAGPEGDADIHTAIAVRNRPGLAVLAQADLEALAVIHAPDDRPVRSGAALLVEAGGTRFWVVSVHLKSGCATQRTPSASIAANCVTFWSQHAPLAGWISEREAEGTGFAIMGDFNRRFREHGFAGEFLSALGPTLAAHPETAGRHCPTRRGRSTEPIDWIVLDETLAARFVPSSFTELLYTEADTTTHGPRLSDHCPIRLDLTF